MSKFKVGDKVRVRDSHKDLTSLNYVLSTKQIHIVSEICVDGIKVENSYFLPDDYFELLKEEKQMFNLKTEKWFIRTPTSDVSDAVAEWLKEQGLRMHALFKQDEHIKSYAENACLCGEGKFDEFGITYGRYQWLVENGFKEIKLKFKTIVDSVEYPSLETEAQKELKALEAKIAELTQHASKLKGLV